MPQPQNYKNRTVHVRNSARAHLRELRQQRMAKRKASLVTDRSMSDQQGVAPEAPAKVVVPPSGPSVEAETPFVQETTETPVEETVDPHMDDVPPHEGQSDIVPEEMAALEVAVEPTDALDDLAIENAAMSEMSADVQLSDPSEPVVAELAVEPPVVSVPEPELDTAPDSEIGTDAVEVDPLENASAVDQASEGDLAELPGAGPGLIWMLNQCGISSLQQLAAADPTRLSTDMGVVGQILDVEKWIAFAAAR